MPEETNGAENRRMEDRLERLEREAMRENRYWKGGLIGSLLLIAIALFTSGGHHRRERPEFARGGRYAMPYPPPQFGYMAGGPWGPCGGRDFARDFGHRRPWDAPRPDANRPGPQPPSATN
ncbi:MAG: hypothetical protein Q7S58_17105 [Candidatus Binatus sp.]|uniref:hypothetical protein n=1 Tax=Candidatus Binatus sp. TaxID=2811406 RepID=UPI002719D7C9|nr:hypothetical protein [Candidatus Binatus sp.]MDO8434119.1 hypothetical protein [Candidatus Binatus sp.]